MLRRAHRFLLVPGALMILATSGCDVPDVEGPQIQARPPGFTMNPDTYLENRMFPELEAIHHDAWVEASWGNFSGIYINGHAGNLSREWAESAHTAAMTANAGEHREYGEIEELTVDGRASWGWTEWWRLENGGLDYVVYRALIPYDTISYTVEFLTGDPSLKIRPDSLRTIVASFAIGKTTWNVPLLAVMAGMVLLLGNMFRSRRAAQAARARGITLVRIPKKEDDEKKPDPGGSIAQAMTQTLDEKGPPPSSD